MLKTMLRGVKCKSTAGQLRTARMCGFLYDGPWNVMPNLEIRIGTAVISVPYRSGLSSSSNRWLIEPLVLGRGVISGPNTSHADFLDFKLPFTAPPPLRGQIEGTGRACMGEPRSDFGVNSGLLSGDRVWVTGGARFWGL